MLHAVLQFVIMRQIVNWFLKNHNLLLETISGRTIEFYASNIKPFFLSPQIAAKYLVILSRLGYIKLLAIVDGNGSTDHDNDYTLSVTDEGIRYYTSTNQEILGAAYALLINLAVFGLGYFSGTNTTPTP